MDKNEKKCCIKFKGYFLKSKSTVKPSGQNVSFLHKLSFPLSIRLFFFFFSKNWHHFLELTSTNAIRIQEEVEL